MMTFLEIILTGIGLTALLFGVSYAIVSIWTAVSEAAEQRRRDTKRVLRLLERIEANTAPDSESEISTNDPA